MAIFRLTARRCGRLAVFSSLTLLALAPPIKAELYVGGYVGGTRTAASDISLEQYGAGLLIFHSVPFRGRSFHSPIYYGYRAGYYFTRHFGVDAEFIHLKIYADLDHPVEIEGSVGGTPVHERAPMRNYLQQFEVTHGLNMVLINGVARKALLGSRDPKRSPLVLAVRAGAGPTIPRPEVAVLGIAGGSYQLGPVAVQGAAGIEGRLWRALRMIGEYKYTFTPSCFEVPNGRAALHVHTQHAVAGLVVHF